MTTAERWLPVVGFEGLYEVSDHGRVRSLDRVLHLERKDSKGRTYSVSRRHRGVMLQPGRMKTGHMVVALGRGTGTILVHTLVLTAFVGPKPDGMECCHGDGDPTNNHVSNLRWGTRSDNVQDMLRHGTHRGGPKPGCGSRTVLREADIQPIRALARHHTDTEIAARYGVTRAAIYSIRTGRTWSHVPEEAA